MKTKEELEKMIQKLWNIESRAPQWAKENYQHAYEVLEWVLGKRDEEEVILFGE